MKILFWLGIAFIIAGAAIYGDTYYQYKRLNWTPLSIPVSLEPGKLQTGEFKLVRKVPYDVELMFDQGRIDPQRMMCLSGTEAQSEKECRDTPSVVDMSWTIADGSNIVARGSSRDSGGGNSFERLLGDFRPPHDGRYTLSAEVRKDGSVLDIANPRLQVVIDLFERDGIAMSEAFGGLESATSAGIGVVLLVGIAAAIYMRRRRRLRASTAI